MIIKFLEDLLHWNEAEEVLDTEYEPFRNRLSLAGLSEEELQKMDPGGCPGAGKLGPLRFSLSRLLKGKLFTFGVQWAKMEAKGGGFP